MDSITFSEELRHFVLESAQVEMRRCYSVSRFIKFGMSESYSMLILYDILQ